jgi:hypothetical protein
MSQRKRLHSWASAWALSALAAMLLCGLALSAAADSPQTIYRYVNAKGRPVFVNDLSRVPKVHQAKAKALDLSTVSINQALGSELKKAVDEEIERLAASGYCVQLRKSAHAGWLSTAWRRHSHLIVIGAVMLLLLGASPWITDKMPGPQWGRILLLALPALAMLALWTTAVVKTTRTTRLLRAAAAPCEPETYRKLPSTPQAQRQRLGMIGKLKAQITEARTGRHGAIDAALREGAGKGPKRPAWIGPAGVGSAAGAQGGVGQ